MSNVKLKTKQVGYIEENRFTNVFPNIISELSFPDRASPVTLLGKKYEHDNFPAERHILSSLVRNILISNERQSMFDCPVLSFLLVLLRKD